MSNHHFNDDLGTCQDCDERLELHEETRLCADCHRFFHGDES